ncbi:MAG: SlyX family protein [Opitutales bacterium]|nr:SlyX family protein [Opitutales bacterium]MBQ8445820.1 SlyX family protein [Opitutales bacterium]MBQ9758588.1 SlyX family protein [Opitutales bacterium]
MTEAESAEARLKELEIKITFLDDYVSKQNRTILELSREIDKLTRALRSLAEKTEALGDGNVPPANEKPPHW